MPRSLSIAGALLAASARPRPDDLGPDEETRLALVSRARGKRADSAYVTFRARVSR